MTLLQQNVIFDTRTGEWALHFYWDQNDHQLPQSFYVSGSLPCLILSESLVCRGIDPRSRNCRKKCSCLAVYRGYIEVLLSGNVPRMIFLHSVQECNPLVCAEYAQQQQQQLTYDVIAYNFIYGTYD